MTSFTKGNTDEWRFFLEGFSGQPEDEEICQHARMNPHTRAPIAAAAMAVSSLPPGCNQDLSCHCRIWVFYSCSSGLFWHFLWSRRVNIGRDCVVRGCAWLICTRIPHHSVWHTPRDSRQQHHLSHDGDRVPLMLPGYVVFLTVFRRMFPLPPIFRPPAL